MFQKLPSTTIFNKYVLNTIFLSYFILLDKKLKNYATKNLIQQVGNYLPISKKDYQTCGIASVSSKWKA